MGREPSTRERIVDSAIGLLEEGGRDAVSTRAVSAAAGVQAPTIYRIFGDMRGLLDAVADRGFADYLVAKTARARASDPVDDLRAGWDQHVAFGLEHPELYALIYGSAGPVDELTANESLAVLRELVGAIAEAGRLATSVDRAVQMVHAASSGVTFLLIATPVAARDDGLSTQTREAILAAITIDDDEGYGDDGDGARAAADDGHGHGLEAAGAAGMADAADESATSDLTDGVVETGIADEAESRSGIGAETNTSAGTSIGTTVGTRSAPGVPTTSADWRRVVARVTSLRAALPELSADLSPAELLLMAEWLDRVADSRH